MRYCYVVEGVYFHISKKMSDDDLNEFKKEFDADLTLEKVSVNKSGDKYEFEYHCRPSMLDEFISRVHMWLRNHGFPVRFTIFSNDISLKCHKKLSECQIKDFEEEFGVKCSEYELDCRSDSVNYVFS